MASPYRRAAAAFAMAAAFVALPQLCRSQTYPNQPIKVIVPFTPGTGMDIIARTVGPKLSERLKQPVVVENKPGASGNIGAESVARATADGHTLMVSANTMVITPNLYRSVPYDAVRDFQPISLAAWGTLALVANPKRNFGAAQDLIKEAKTKPGKLSYGSPGVGTPHHLSMELFKDLTDTDILHVPYKGTAGAVTDLISGELDVMFLPIHVAIPHVQGGRLKALAVGSPKRHSSAPNLPSLQELGIKGADVDMWYGFLAPKGTPGPVVSKLNTELRAILGEPDVKSVFEKQGLDATASTPEQLRTLMEKDSKRWGDLIKKNNITAE